MLFLPFIVLQIVIFIALVVVLRRALSRNLTEAASHLQGLSADYSRRQEELKQRLQEAEQQYTERMAKVKTEAEQLMTQAKQEAESSRGKLLEEARSESERIVQQGLESRNALRKELEQAMEARAIERACELLRELLPEELRREVQARYLRELIQDSVGQLGQLKTDESLSQAKVACAYPLDAAQRDDLSRWIKERVGRELTLVEEADGQLIAGLMITLGSVVLDASLASKMRQVVRRVQQTS